MAAPSKKVATFDDLVARGDCDRLEIIGGEIVEKAAPSVPHALGEFHLGGVLGPLTGRGGPGGWWILLELHVGYEAGEVYCHDAAAYRRTEGRECPSGWPVRTPPDWVCEIASPKHERTDFVVKPAVLHRAKVAHYWVLHPEEKMLLVHRWSPDGYVVVLRATSGHTVRAEPFDAIEIAVGELFGEDD
jgi:Uma2 family endonuclease